MTEATTYFDDLVDMLDIPERNCSCHISPPCADCVDNGGLREAVADVRLHLTRDRKDALRYRALRDATNTNGFWIANGEFSVITRWTGKTADAAIDAAIVAATGGGHG